MKFNSQYNINNMFSYGIIYYIGIPFPAARDPCVLLKQEHNTQLVANGNKNCISGNVWYSQQAYRAVNQAIGRTIRHRDDYGAIIFLDSRYEQLQHVNGLSKWVRTQLLATQNKSITVDQAQLSLQQFFDYWSIHGVKRAEKIENVSLQDQRGLRGAFSYTRNRKKKLKSDIVINRSSLGTDPTKQPFKPVKPNKYSGIVKIRSGINSNTTKINLVNTTVCQSTAINPTTSAVEIDMDDNDRPVQPANIKQEIMEVKQHLNNIKLHISNNKIIIDDCSQSHARDITMCMSPINNDDDILPALEVDDVERTASFSTITDINPNKHTDTANDEMSHTSNQLGARQAASVSNTLQRPKTTALPTAKSIKLSNGFTTVSSLTQPIKLPYSQLINNTNTTANPIDSINTSTTNVKRFIKQQLPPPSPLTFGDKSIADSPITVDESTVDQSVTIINIVPGGM